MTCKHFPWQRRRFNNAISGFIKSTLSSIFAQGSISTPFHDTKSSMIVQHKPIGILGGTFDPIHNGHLRLAIELYERLDLDEIHLIPSAYPPHRESPSASAQLRLAMVQAAIVGVEGLVADDRELRRAAPSYMVDTLHSLREEYPERSLCLILGMDAFMGLPQWHQWERLIEYANLVVVQRLGKLLPIGQVIRDFLNTYQISELHELSTRPAGGIFIQDIPMLTISATQIRSLLMMGKNPCYLLPERVLDLIQTHQLYR